MKGIIVACSGFMESYAANENWPLWQGLALRFITCFLLLALLTVAYPHSWLPLPAQLLHQPFDWLAQATGSAIFGVGFKSRTVSDSIGMQVHFFNLLWLSAFGAAWWSLSGARRIGSNKVAAFLVIIARYFLAWQLLRYGFNKIFKWQFFLPEPNIQYTELGRLSRDILYWSVMGTSRTYSVFLGSVEALAALLLLWRKTSLFGALLAAGVLVNVLMVNIGFEITVKIFSALLLLLSMIIIIAQRGRFKALLLMKQSVALPAAADSRIKFRVVFKIVAILLLFSDAAYPYLRSGNFNDDAFPRPPLHGAYRLTDMRGNAARWKRLFIHRNGYLILQDTAGAFTDYELETDTVMHALWLSRDGDSEETALYYTCQAADSSLLLNGMIGADSVAFKASKLPLRWPGGAANQ